MKDVRPYEQTRRNESSAATRGRIIEAAATLFLARWYDEISLREVAAEAGVAVQTVVNHFGTKAGLTAAVVPRVGAGIDRARATVAAGDVDGAIATLVTEYERMGDAIVRALALEGRIPEMTELLAFGRREHRGWVERVFAAWIPPAGDSGRKQRVALLVAATDVLMWKLLRRDQGLSRADTERSMRELVRSLIDGEDER